MNHQRPRPIQNEVPRDDISEYDQSEYDYSEYDYSEHDYPKDDPWMQNITVELLYQLLWMLLSVTLALVGKHLADPVLRSSNRVFVLVILVGGALVNCVMICTMFGRAACSYIPANLLLGGLIMVYYPVLLLFWSSAHYGAFVYLHHDHAVIFRDRTVSADKWLGTQLVKMGIIVVYRDGWHFSHKFCRNNTRDWLQAQVCQIQAWRPNFQSSLPFGHTVLQAEQTDVNGPQEFGDSHSRIIQKYAEPRKATAKEAFAYICSHEELVQKHSDLESEYKNLEERSFWLMQALEAASTSSQVREREHAEQIRGLHEQREYLIKVYEKRLKAMN